MNKYEFNKKGWNNSVGFGSNCDLNCLRFYNLPGDINFVEKG
jgi:hypothetical protein